MKRLDNFIYNFFQISINVDIREDIDEFKQTNIYHPYLYQISIRLLIYEDLYKSFLHSYSVLLWALYI